MVQCTVNNAQLGWCANGLKRRVVLASREALPFGSVGCSGKI